MARIRLTNKTRIANDPSDMEGVRQDCGNKTRYKKYTTKFDPAKDDVGGRGKAQTDGSKLYEGDKSLRNEMHVTELKLKQAKMWQRSKLATKLAMYLLGQKAPQSMIKAQAAQFLSLGNAKLAKAVSRWAKTEYLYAEQEEAPVKEQTAQQEQKKEQTEATAQEVKQEAPAVEQTPAQEVKQEAPAVEQTPAQEVKQEVKTEESDQGECKNCGTEPCTCDACGDVKAEQTQEQACVATTDEVPQEVVQQGCDQFDEAALASLFEDNSNTLVAKKTEAKSGKVGVQKFDQPQRTASNKVSLDQLWEGAPDLSNIF